jgi:ABC-type nitrate/sulfonate/bicarbonate transport system substrate-binding protein
MINVVRVITVAAMLVCSCGVLHAQEKTKFPLAVSSKTLGYGILWAAQKQGFFDRQGLEVQLVVMRGADKAVQALVGGSVYVSASGADASIGAVEHGLDLVIVGGVINGLTHMVMGAKNVRTYDDLRGATIAASSASLTSGTTLVMRRMLKAKGLEFPRDYQIMGTGGSGPAFTALTSGQIAAAFVAIPLSFAAADMGYHIIGRVVDVIPNYQLAALAVHRSWAEQNRPLLIRFLKGVVLGARWLIENKQPAIDFLVKEMDLKPEHARRGWEYYVEHRIWDPNADVNIEGVKTALQVYAEQAQMKGPLPSYSKYVDQSYLKEAVKELGAR